MADLSPADRAALVAAWDDLRSAVRELAAVDCERARLYISSASCSLRSWTRALRSQHCGPSSTKPDPGPEPRQ